MAGWTSDLLWTLLACLMVLAAASSAVRAAPTPPLVSLDHSTVRLFSASGSPGNWTAGLEIALAPGWKTYWRMPGESGVPPSLDWSQSVNLSDLVMAWPAPHRFHDAAGEAIGYQDKVVFPLRLFPLRQGDSVTLDLKLFYAACKDICIPAEARLAIELPPDSRGHPHDLDLIEQFAGRVPREPSAGSSPAIAGVRLHSQGASQYLHVTLDSPLDSSTTDIFVEGFDGAYFGRPRAQGNAQLATVFLLPIDGLDEPGHLRGRTLTLTLVSGITRFVQPVAVH
jgi:DsbC/DsbD-like thiol-disulfide interchange protein